MAKEYKIKSIELLRERLTRKNKLSEKELHYKKTAIMMAIRNAVDEFLVTEQKWLKFEVTKDLDVAISIIPELEEFLYIQQDSDNPSIFHIALKVVDLFEEDAGISGKEEEVRRV